MSGKLEELKLDIEEITTLLQQAKRQKAKDLLSLELRRLQTEMGRLEEVNKEATLKSAGHPSTGPQKCYEVKLNNYGWDQTASAVKLYITLDNVHQLPKEAVTANFTDRSVDLRILGLDNKNYNLPINNLAEDIDPEKSSVKVKTNMVIVSLAKRVHKDWTHITGVEKRIKEAKSSAVADVADDGDPGASLMNLMKKLYNEGDDEWKRTIAKVWTENQDRREGKGGPMDLPLP